MREIKFRAYSKNYKKMIYFDLTGKNIVSGGIYDGLGLCDESFDRGYDYLTDENFEVMEFTGLKDKRGNDVYEMDIIQMDNESKVLTLEKAIVEYSYGVARVRPTYDRFFRNTLNETCYNFLGFKEKDGVSGLVIGNIYENPELVEYKDETNDMEEK